MKKAILVVSFGSGDIEAVNKSITVIEREVALEFKEYDVVRAFTAHRIIKKFKDNFGVEIKSPEGALDNLKSLGYEEVIIQPLHIIAGEEYDYLKKVFLDNKVNFKKISLGRPIFYYGGTKDTPNDYIEFIKAIENDILDKNKNIVLFGHGTAHMANAAYGCLQSILEFKGYSNTFVTTIVAYPNFEDLAILLKRKKIERVKIQPLLLLAGHHAKKDMIGANDKALKSYLESNGISVEVSLKGLGEYKEFRVLYISRIRDAINETYNMIGETKKYKK